MIYLPVVWLLNLGYFNIVGNEAGQEPHMNLNVYGLIFELE